MKKDCKHDKSNFFTIFRGPGHEQKRMFEDQVDADPVCVICLLEDLKSYEQTFDLQHDADMRGIKMWQKATGRKKEWPDRGKMIFWLLERLDVAQQLAERVLARYNDPQGIHETEELAKRVKSGT